MESLLDNPQYKERWAMYESALAVGLPIVSREDNARRRLSEETPEARRARVAKAQITRNKSIRRDKIRLHWGMEPIGKLVKRW